MPLSLRRLCVVLELIVISTLNGVLFGILLLVLSSGLTSIFSMLGVLNFAHASFYMLGAFFGFQVARWFGFWPALLIAPLLAGAIGAGVERFGLRRVHKNGHVAELLFTFGLAYAIEEIVQITWGQSPVDFRVSPLLDFPAFTIFSTNYPAYKMFMLLVSIGIFAALLITLKRTRIGLIVQAALTHPHMVGHLGHNVGRIFMLVFGVGTALAAVAGVIAGPALVTQANMAGLLGPILFVVVVVGGLGSLPGAFVASLLIGLVQTFAVSMNGSLTTFSLIGISIIFALSYNILLGQTGMLSFGHAVYYGLGGFLVIHAINIIGANKLPMPLPIVPLIGGLTGLLFAILLGWVSTKRSGTAFAMISLGVAELIASSALILRTFFGGEAGISANRTKLLRVFDWNFGPQIQIYYLIAAWTVLAVMAMSPISRPPLGRMCNAVRDNPARVTLVSYVSHVVRFLAFCFAGFFAGIAGGLAAINFEIANSAYL